jgi:hypothetical protein
VKDKEQIVDDWLPRYTGVPLDQFTAQLEENFSSGREISISEHFFRMGLRAAPGRDPTIGPKFWGSALTTGRLT